MAEEVKKRLGLETSKSVNESECREKIP